jgi:MFS family permease
MKRIMYYKWFILLMGTATFFFTIGLGRPCLPVLFKEIMDELGLSIFEIGTVWGMDSFAGALVALPAGLLIDRFSIKYVTSITCILIGLFGAARGLSNDFFSMSITMFIFGLFAPMTTTIIPKIISIWFDKRRLGLANSILIMGITIGAMVSTSTSATFMSPLVGGWRNLLFLYGTFPIMMGFLWIISFKEPEKITISDKSSDVISFKKNMLHVIKTKQVWVLGFILFGHMGAYGGFIGYLPVYLREIGWSPVHADGALTLFLGLITVASIPMALISDRIGSRKRILVPSLVLSYLFLALIPFVEGKVLWVIIVLHGLARGGLMALFRALVIETEGIGAEHAGTATGLTNMLLMIGYAVFPPLGNSLAHIHLGLPFILWAALSSLMVCLFVYVKEEGAG